jgi:hypothetical protein
MKLRLFQRRTIWCPTWLGWLCLLALLGALPGWWFIYGEGVLSLTARQPSEVLVVEGWIGREGMRAAKTEFDQGGYRYLVATGGYTGEGWMDRRWSYAEMAEKELLRLGVPRERVLVAQAGDLDTQRTYQAAVATRQALASHGIRPVGVNVFTRGPHSRRSRLVFAKVLDAGTRVGAISWNPPGSHEGAWWRSSDRAKELITETAAYVYEVVAGSGRWLHRAELTSPSVPSGSSSGIAGATSPAATSNPKFIAAP